MKEAITEKINDMYLSTVLGRPVINERGRKIGTLDDLVMAPGETFPEVSHLIVKNGKRLAAIPWSSILLFNRFVALSAKLRDLGFLAGYG